jgi:hypothetical protein
MYNQYYCQITFVNIYHCAFRLVFPSLSSARATAQFLLGFVLVFYRGGKVLCQPQSTPRTYEHLCTDRQSYSIMIAMINKAAKHSNVNCWPP